MRIPAQLAYERLDMEMEIERIGDEIRIRPKPRRLDQLLSKFGQFSSDVMAQGRAEEEEAERGTL